MGMDAEVSYREPRNGQYVLELKLSGKTETLVVCAAPDSGHADHTASIVRGLLHIPETSGLLDIFATVELPRIDDYDALCGLAKFLEYTRNSLLDGSLASVGNLKLTPEIRQRLLTVDDMVKSYRRDGAGLVIGHQRELEFQYARGPVSDVEKASLERILVRK